MSFLVSAEQFKKAFEEENLNEQFMNDLLSYLKKHLYIKRLRKMYEWIRVEKDAKELEMAIYLYVYTKREKEEHDGVNE